MDHYILFSAHQSRVHYFKKLDIEVKAKMKCSNQFLILIQKLKCIPTTSKVTDVDGDETAFKNVSLIAVQVIRTLQSQMVTSLPRMILLFVVRPPDCVITSLSSGTTISPNVHVNDEDCAKDFLTHSKSQFPGLMVAVELFMQGVPFINKCSPV